MKYIIYILLGASSYGILSTLAKASYNAGFTPADATGSQMILGLLIMWILAFIFRKENSPVSMKTAGRYMLMGLPIGLTSVFYYQSVQFLPASVAILLLFQFIWVGLIIESIANKSWPSLMNIISVLILLIGTVMASGIEDFSNMNYTLKGIIYGLLSGVSYAFFIFFNRDGKVKLSAYQKSGFMLIGGTVISLIMLPPVFLFNGSLSQGLLNYGLPLALFGAVIPPLLYAIAVPKVGSGLSSILSAVELPAAVLIASIFLKEQVTIIQWLGVLIIILGIILPWMITRLKDGKVLQNIQYISPKLKKRA